MTIITTASKEAALMLADLADATVIRAGRV
jgi:hypothetical protein